MHPLRSRISLLAVLGLLVTLFPGRPSAAAGLKPGVAGIMTRNGQVPDGQTFLDQTVVPVAWADLESSDQAFDGPGWAAIGDALADPAIRIKLRIYAGGDAPAFVKALSGPPRSGDGVDCSGGGIAVIIPNSGVSGCVPYFWTPAVLEEYEEMMTEVARRYEGHSRLLEVVDSACMTVFAEPFYRANSHLGSNARLWEAGLRETLDTACHERAMEIQERLFPTTRTALAVNPWDVIVDPATDADGRVQSWTKTREFADRWRARIGARLVLQNNGLGEDDGCEAVKTASTSHFCYLASVSGPMGFQTETWAKLGGTSAGLYAALDNALSMGACFVELPRGWSDSQNRLPDYDRRLAANCDSADTRAPTIPGNLRTLAVGATSVDLAWDPSTDDTAVTGYRVNRDGLAFGEVTGTSFVDASVSPLALYVYTVTALDAAGNESLPSLGLAVTTLGLPDLLAPSAPSNLRSPAQSASWIDLAWDASIDDVGVAGYEVIRDGASVAEVAGTSFTDAELAPGATHSYEVKAFDATGNVSASSVPLAVCTILVDLQPPTAPGSLRTTGKTRRSVSLAWSASADNVGVTGYAVFRDGAWIATVTTLSFTDTALRPSTSYAYKVRAKDEAGNVSAFTPTLTVKTRR